MFDVSRSSRNPVMRLIFNKNFLGLQKLLDHSLSAGTKTQEYLSIVYLIAFVVNFFLGPQFWLPVWYSTVLYFIFVDQVESFRLE